MEELRIRFRGVDFKGEDAETLEGLFNQLNRILEAITVQFRRTKASASLDEPHSPATLIDPSRREIGRLSLLRESQNAVPDRQDEAYLQVETDAKALGWRRIPLIDAATFAKSVTSGPYNMKIDDEVILADATSAELIVKLPPAANCKGRMYTIKRVNGGAPGNLVRVQTQG